MIAVTGLDLDEAFLSLSRHLRDAPVVSPREQATRELVGVAMEITRPESCVLQHPARQLSTRYIRAEIDWYLSGSRSTEQIARHAQAWSAVADPDGTANSAYGWQLFVQKTPRGSSQFDDAVHTIVEDPNSRRAVLNIHQVRHKYSTNDVPCTIALQFLVRDSQLHQLVYSRSTDLIWGLGNDMPFFVFVQCMLSAALRKQGISQVVGSYSQVFGSLHVYERHFNMLEQVCGSEEEYRSGPLTSVLSNGAKCALVRGGPHFEKSRGQDDMHLRTTSDVEEEENWRENVRKKISRIKEEEDSNMYPFY